MTRVRHSLIAIAIFLFVVLCAALSLFNPGVRRTFFSGGLTAETRGMQVAMDNGCFLCHGPEGAGGVVNPGGSSIPSWRGAAQADTIQSEADLRAWILDAGPKRIHESKAWQERRAYQAALMPVYRGMLTQGEVDDLVAYLQVVTQAVTPREPLAAQGMQIAQEMGCFSCHALGGRVDTPNPRSLTGYIPAFSGPDYPKLVQNDEELRAWILDGGHDRLDQNPFALYFLKRQAIDMPPYHDLINETQLEAIMAYIKWLRDPEAPGHQPTYSSPDLSE